MPNPVAFCRAAGLVAGFLVLAASASAQPTMPSGGAPAYPVELRSGAFTPPANLEEFFGPAGEPTDIADGVYYRLVQFWELPTKDRRARLERAWHIRLLDYLPKNTFVVAFPASFNRQLLMGYNVRSVFQLPPEARLAPTLRTASPPTAGAPTAVFIETISGAEAPDPDALRTRIRTALQSAGAADLTIPDTTAPQRFRALVPASKLSAVAAVPGVLSVEPVPAPPKPAAAVPKKLKAVRKTR